MGQSLDFEVLDVITSELKENQVRVQIGNALSGKGVANSAALYCADGFYGRPVDAALEGETKGAAQAFVARNGEQRVVVGLRDNRWIGAYGTLQPGDRAIASHCDAAFFLKRETSAIVAFSNNQKSDESMVLEINGQDGEIRIVNGKCALVISEEKITITNGKTTIMLDDDGLFGFGAHCGLNFNGGNLGTLGSVPPTTPPFGVLFGVSGVAGVPSVKWSIAG